MSAFVRPVSRCLSGWIGAPRLVAGVQPARRRWLPVVVALLLSVAGCGEGRALDLLLDPACITGASTVEIVVTPAGMAPRTERHDAEPLLTGGRRVVVLLPDGVNMVSVAVSLLDAQGRGLGGGALTVALDASGVTHATLVLSAPACPGDGGVPDLPVSDGGAADLTVLPTPSLSTVSPASAPTTGGTPIIITGNGFRPGAAVQINNLAAAGVVVVSPTQINATVPASPGTIGPVPVKVTNSDGQSAVRADLFAYHLGELRLSTPLAFPVDKQPYGIVAADFNNDGFLDVATANQVAFSISVLLGRLDGGFAPAQAYPLVAPSNTPNYLAVGDFDGNGKLDLASSNQTDVTVLFGKGDGTFAMPLPFGTAAARYVGLAAGDLDGDKIDDLVATRDDNSVAVMISTGKGSFGAPRVVPVMGAHQLVLGDFNGDGRRDVLVGTLKQSGSVVLLPGTGDPMKLLGAPVVTMNAVECEGMAAGDLDGDGDLDAALGGESRNAVAVLINDGKGAFTPTTYSTSVNTYGTAIGDFTGDGKADVAAVNFGSNTLSVLDGDGKGGFAATRNQGVGGKSVALAAGDFNRDGRTDVVFSRFDGASVGVLLQDASGRFFGHRKIVVGAPGPVGLTLADLDGDKHLDVVVAAYAQNMAGSIAIHKGDGDGNFALPKLLPVGKGPWLLAVGDLNTDGRPDLVSTNSGGASASVLINTGGLSFLPGSMLVTGPQPRGVIIDDFDGDKKPEVVVGDTFDPNLSLFRGMGDGSFAARLTLPTGTASGAVVSGDWNGDGKQDLAYAAASGAVVSLLSNGDLTFRSQVPVLLDMGQPPSLLVADWNRDGKPDLAVVEALTARVVVLLGRGDGTFAIGASVPLPGADLRFAALGDLDGDGAIELLVPDLAHSLFFTITGLAGVSAVRAWASGPQNYSMAVGDFNEDGRPDVVAGTFGDDAFRVITNIGR